MLISVILFSKIGKRTSILKLVFSGGHFIKIVNYSTQVRKGLILEAFEVCSGDENEDNVKTFLRIVV